MFSLAGLIVVFPGRQRGYRDLVDPERIEALVLKAGMHLFGLAAQAEVFDRTIDLRRLEPELGVLRQEGPALTFGIANHPHLRPETLEIHRCSFARVY